MPIGLQEILALGIVLAVVAFALWRRWTRANSRASDGRAACSGCDDGSAATVEEKPIRIYRRHE